ncbi:type III-B CRISPR module RAMP protein Cmr4 [Paenibacillus chitinolyticus]|uniref:type III-B CRISPR module RAMP protein Cmr4 n=1 Tax=Paenibacillus chitinolyticus TaxID=79263 RepID=UPI00365CE1F9
MYKQSRALFFQVLTSMHAGEGSQLGVVDLPIQREGHTGFPKVEASSLKGSLRRAVEQRASDVDVQRFFGPDGQSELYASALSFSDVRLLFFPVRSVKGVFAWVTCPMVIKRFLDDMRLVQIEISEELSLDTLPVITENSGLDAEGRVMLEEYVFTVEKEKKGELTAFLKRLLQMLPASDLVKQHLISHAIVVSDDDFSDFVRLSTEIVTRIKINNETGTVAGTALFNEEYLPSESLMYSLVFISDEHQAPSKSADPTPAVREKAEDIANTIENWIPATFQIGANLTLGKGFVAVKLVSGGALHAQTNGQ